MLAFDIETVPLLSAMQSPYPEDREPPANYKNEDAIARWREKDRASWDEGRIKEYSLNPRLGRVVAFACWNEQGGRSAVAQTEADEHLLLEDFWTFLRHDPLLVGWNSQGFDLPFIVVRSLLLGVTPHVDVAKYLKRYSYAPHFDVKAALLAWDVRRAGEGLHEWATAFGLAGKDHHGSEVYGMVQRGEWGVLGSYCRADAKATYDLAERVVPFFGAP